MGPHSAMGTQWNPMVRYGALQKSLGLGWQEAPPVAIR